MKYKLLAMLWLLALCSAAHAETVTITWLLPTTYTDGSALAASAITGFEIDCSAQDSKTDCDYPTYANKTATGAVTSLSYDVGAIPTAGVKLCFRVRTLVASPDTASDYTSSACKTWAAPAKKASAPAAIKAS